MVHAFHESRRIFQLRALAEHGLFEQQPRPVGEAGFILLPGQAPHQRMVGIDFQDRLAVGQIVAGLFHDLLQVNGHFVGAQHQTTGRIGQTMTDAHFADIVTQNLLDARDQVLVLVFGFLRRLFFRLVLQLAEIQIALGDRCQRFAFELGEVRDHPLVDPVVQQQNLDALLAEHFQVRTVVSCSETVRSNEVNLLLAFLHAADIILKRYILPSASAMRRGKAQQFCDTLAVTVVFGRPFLHHPTILRPEFLVFLRFVLCHAFQQAQHLFHGRGADTVDELVLLQDFARHVQRQIVGVDQSADKTQILGHQVFRVVHDEHTAHVQFDAVSAVAVPEIERRMLGNVQQAGVGLGAFHLVVRPGHGIAEIVRHMFVKLPVFVVVDVLARALPQCRSAVYRFERIFLTFLLRGHFDRQGDMIRVARDDGSQAIGFQKLILALAQVQHHLGAASGLVDVFKRIAAFAVRYPPHGLVGGGTGATRGQRDLVGDDEAGVEPDTELADQLQILALVAGERFEKLTCARFRDGTDVVDHFIARHPDTVVADGDGTRILVEADADFQFAVAFVQSIAGKRLEAQLVTGIGGVGNQFAKKDFLVGIQRVDHQLQQLTHFGLKFQGFFARFCRHDLSFTLTIHG